MKAFDLNGGGPVEVEYDTKPEDPRSDWAIGYDEGYRAGHSDAAEQALVKIIDALYSIKGESDVKRR